MFRSLHMKLVLIMTLLIVSLMTVVGAFLTNSVSRFYMDDFYSQMETVFSDAQFARDLVTPAEGETDAVTALQRKTPMLSSPHSTGSLLHWITQKTVPSAFF